MPKKTDEGVTKKTGESSTPMKKSGDTVTSKKTGESATGRATCAWGCGLLRADTTVSRHAKVCPINNRYVCRQCTLRFASVATATTHAVDEHAWKEGDGAPYHHDLRTTREVLDDVTWMPPPLTPRVHLDKEVGFLNRTPVVNVAREPLLDALVISPGQQGSRIVVRSPVRMTHGGDTELQLEVLLLRTKSEAQAQQLASQAEQIKEQALQLAHHRGVETRLLKLFREPPRMLDQYTQTEDVKIVGELEHRKMQRGQQQQVKNGGEVEEERALSLDASDLESLAEEQGLVSTKTTPSLGQRNVRKPPPVLPLMGVPITPSLSTGRTSTTARGSLVTEESQHGEDVTKRSDQRHQRSEDGRSRSDRTGRGRSPTSRRHLSRDRERSRSPSTYRRHASRGRVRSRSPADNRHPSRHPTVCHVGQRGRDTPLEAEAALLVQISELERKLEEAKSKSTSSSSRYRR